MPEQKDRYCYRHPKLGMMDYDTYMLHLRVAHHKEPKKNDAHNFRFSKYFLGDDEFKRSEKRW